MMSLLIPFVHEATTTIIYFYLLETLDKYQFNAEAFSLVKAAFPSVYIGRIVEFWIIYGLFAAFDYYKKYKDKQAEIGRIEAQLNRTKLAVLRMQLQPHFLFNALNSISSLMEIDVRKAQTVTARLGDLLRGILEQDERVFVRLSEEMQYVKTYLEIEKIRFDDRLKIEINVNDSILDSSVPMLLIQPLAENAIKHGTSKSSKQGIIVIRIDKILEDQMIISVSDNGNGSDLNLHELLKKGIGLSNIKARLIELFPETHHLEIISTVGKGFIVNIKIPIIKYYEKH